MSLFDDTINDNRLYKCLLRLNNNFNNLSFLKWRINFTRDQQRANKIMYL